MNTPLKIAGIVALFVLGFFVLGFGTMHLWNWIMPYLFKFPTVDFKMAIGMVVLSKILLGGIRIKTAPIGQRKLWRAKWESMSNEERQEFKTSFAEKCRTKWGKNK